MLKIRRIGRTWRSVDIIQMGSISIKNIQDLTQMVTNDTDLSQEINIT